MIFNPNRLRPRLVQLGIALAVMGLGSALAAPTRLGFLVFTGPDEALNLALPASMARAIESIDNVVTRPPLELFAYLSREGAKAERLLQDFSLKSVIEGQIGGSEGAWTLELRVKRSETDPSLNLSLKVNGADLRTLCANADAELIKVLELKPSAADLKEIASIEGALPNPTLTALTVQASELADATALEPAGDAPWPLAVRGLIYAQRGKANDGLTLSTKAASLAPQDVNALTALGAVQLITGRNAEAKVTLEKALAINPAKPETHYLLGAAIVRLAKNPTPAELAPAGAQFEAAIEANPRFLEASLELADMYARFSRPQEAVDTLIDIMPRMGYELRIHQKLVDLFLAVEPQVALRYLNDIFERISDVPMQALALAAMVPDTAGALDLLQRAMEKFPKSSELAAARASLLERQGQYAEAVKAYRAAIALDAKYTPAQVGLASALVKTGDANEVMAVLTQLGSGKIDPKALTRLYLQAGRLSDASAVVKTLPNDLDALYLTGLLALREGRLEDAKKAFVNVLSVRSDYSDARTALLEIGEASRLGNPALDGLALAFYRLGQGQLDAANPLEAVSALRNALTLAPSSGHVHFLLGVALFQAGEPDEAINAFKEAKARLNNVVVSTNLGAAYLEIGRFDLALDELDAATKLDAKYARAWFYLGVANFQLGYADPARTNLLKAVGLDSNLQAQVKPFLDALKP